ncbi:unnamed protein product [Haemonchus placei]|uniref:Type II secretion system protein L n=1 Tax=Haemonchus placei TaxID=6290 RepID=A0A0N4W6M2_HAEPC|nr:unnamed protein product [Haemonchus placei]
MVKTQQWTWQGVVETPGSKLAKAAIKQLECRANWAHLSSAWDRTVTADELELDAFYDQLEEIILNEKSSTNLLLEISTLGGGGKQGHHRWSWKSPSANISRRLAVRRDL